MGGETGQLESNAQLGFGFEVGQPVAQPEAVAGSEDFVTGAEGEFFIGTLRLEEYLQANQQGWVVRMQALLAELDYSQFTSRYKRTGRRALHPKLVLGLIAYGMSRGQWTLRELERLAVVDLGAMWMSGRVQPDHSTIGKFVLLHREVLSEQFMVELVKHLVKKLQVKADTVAIDGTVIEAVASRYRMLKAEALREAGLSEEAAQILKEREAARTARGRAAEATMMVAQEPEAVVQPTKHGLLRPGYKPSALRHHRGLVIAQAVHGCSETAVVSELLEQHLAVFAVEPPRLLADAGYGGIEQLKEFVRRDIDALVPAGHARAEQPWEKRSSGKHFPKSKFRYDEARDLYHCPAGRTLTPEGQTRAPAQGYVRYRGRECKSCPLRAQCTKSTKAGRTLKRYAGEEYKEAMATVLQQPAALRQWRRRSAVIEPLFADLRERQRLTRFHRRGLNKVKLEFALHCVAYNLRKVTCGTAFFILLTVYVRRPGSNWKLLALATLFSPSSQ
jgi:transposase